MKRIKSKWESLDENVQKWASRLAAVATIVGTLAAAGTWLISQIDNSLAAHIESQTNQMEEQVSSLSNKVDDQSKQTELQLTRLELMTLMDSDPDNVVEIEKVAYHYFRDLNGNSYMSSLYNSWCHKYGGDCGIMLK